MCYVIVLIFITQTDCYDHSYISNSDNTTMANIFFILYNISLCRTH